MDLQFVAMLQFLWLPTIFSPSRQHKPTFICGSLAYKPPKAAIHCSCIVMYDFIYCAHNKCGCTNTQTNRHGNHKAILVLAGKNGINIMGNLADMNS